MDDITDRQPHPIDEVVVSEDGLALGVRYAGAAEPCSGAVAMAVESDASVTVGLESGLNPDAATMTCIAQVMLYELRVELDAPLGDRELIIDQGPSAGGGDDSASNDDSAGGGDEGAGGGTGDEGDSMGDLSPPDAFIGLGLSDASALADSENRPWRIGREDDEAYALTEDYIEDRVTFEVDDGVVTAAVLG